MKSPIPNPDSLPLPWRAERIGNHAYWLYADGKNHSFMAVTDTRDDTPQTLQARAKLFAASPVLLSALEHVFEWLMEVEEPDSLGGFYGTLGTVIQAVNTAKDYCESGECRGDGFPAFGDVLCPECRAIYPDWEQIRVESEEEKQP